jgi:hypothetical protein
MSTTTRSTIKPQLHTRRIGHLMDHQILMKIRLGAIAEDEHFSQNHLQNTVGLPFRILCA